MTFNENLNITLLYVKIKPNMPEEKKIKLLVIDDDEQICALIKDYLQSTGNYRVLTAKGANMGSWFAACQWHRPDVITLDIMMPGVDGIELLRRLKGDKKTMYIPVIMFTGKTDMATKVKAEGLYCDDYLMKPIELKVLKEHIEAVLKKRGLFNLEEEAPKEA